MELFHFSRSLSSRLTSSSESMEGPDVDGAGSVDEDGSALLDASQALDDWEPFDSSAVILAAADEACAS